MAKYYTPKLTEAQYNHVLLTMRNMQKRYINQAISRQKNKTLTNHYECIEHDIEDQKIIKLHERTEEALMKAQENTNG